jgi:uncharacterized repeat protein (TIGR03803 family)
LSISVVFFAGYCTTVGWRSPAGARPFDAAAVRALPGTPSGYRESVLHRFHSGGDGINPNGVLVVDASSAIYGTTFFGGSGGGTVFKLSPTGARDRYAESILYAFTCNAGGINPYAGLLAGANGALYGTTSGGCDGYGTIFKLTPAGSSYAQTVLYRFKGMPDGADPNSALIPGKNGTLYGTTDAGGSAGLGSVFRLTPSASGYTERIIYSFLGDAHGDGTDPSGGLILDANGAIYGTTVYGGIEGCGDDGCGTAFRLTPSKAGYVETILYSFGPRPDGFAPAGALLAGPGGALYGAMTFGGASRHCDGTGCGNVFRLTPSGSTYAESILYNFRDLNRGAHDGSHPSSNLIAGSNGALYGTTEGGGGHHSGTLFRLTPSGSTYTESILYNFKRTADQFGPTGLAEGPDGSLYGVLPGAGGPNDCGSNQCGAIFKLHR